MKSIITALTPIVAIGAIVALVCVAMAKGINGVLLAGSLTVIAGLAGWTGKIAKDKITKPKG